MSTKDPRAKLPDAPLADNERLKGESNLLRGTIKEDLKNRVQFIFMPSFDPKEIEMYLLKYSRMGYTNVFIDLLFIGVLSGR